MPITQTDHYRAFDASELAELLAEHEADAALLGDTSDVEG